MKIIGSYFVPIDEIDGDAILKKIERCARTSYKSEDKITENSANKLIKNCITRGHESILEHESISVRIVCDRGVSHELVRHRLASYTQESTRYCKYKEGIKLVAPYFIMNAIMDYEEACVANTYGDEQVYGGECLKNIIHWVSAMRAAELWYTEMLKDGFPPQAARSVLPNSLATEIVVTMNLREWRHFFKLRCAKDAHPDIRTIARSILYYFNDKIPVIFEDIYTSLQPTSYELGDAKFGPFVLQEEEDLTQRVLWFAHEGYERPNDILDKCGIHNPYLDEDDEEENNTEEVKMKKVFISQAMRGRTDEEIFKERNFLIEKATYLISEPIEIIDSFIKEDAPEGVNVPVHFLGRSIKLLAEADYAYFGDGWENARGCKIEHDICEAYGIDILNDIVEDN